jgi:membrane-associated phospholipid phosphatase
MCILAHFTARLPGDVLIAQLTQRVLPGPDWASTVTSLVAWPRPFVLGAVMFGLVWWLASLRTALVGVVAFGVIWAIGEPVKALVQRPRPTPDLVRVAGSPHGFGFPSTFATIWAAAWWPVLLAAWPIRRTSVGATAAVLAATALLVGVAARVVPGAHWPSDILGAYLIVLAVWTVIDGASTLMRRA